MKQSECMSIINRLFNEHIKSNEQIFKSYCYCDHRACDLIVNFKKMLRSLDLSSRIAIMRTELETIMIIQSISNHMMMMVL